LGIVTLAAFSAAQQIALGGADALGTLGLTDAELSNVQASALQVTGNSGNIGVTSTVTRHAGYNALSLTTGSRIV